MHSGCIMGHETTLNYLNDFKDSLLQSDLLVSFVDKGDLRELQREKRDALHKVSKLVSQLKEMQGDMVCYFGSIWKNDSAVSFV